MNSEAFPVQIPEGDTIRADKFVASLGLFTRSQISRRSVRVKDEEGQEFKMSRRLRDGDVVVVDWDDPPSSDILPEDLPLEILHEDSQCWVLNKAQGMVVHPAHGHLHGTLVQGLLFQCKELEEAFGGDKVRPGVVHRLDKDTSGLIVAAKNPQAMEALSAQFRERSVEKYYLAVVRGSLPQEKGDIDAPIGRSPHDRKKFDVGVRNAKTAHSRYQVLARSGHHALVLVRILTGRTHQIRVHLKSLGAPILGDPIYGRRDERFSQATLMLHSWRLSITLPGEDGARLFQAPLPPRFHEILEDLNIPLTVLEEQRCSL
ncbi:MAG: RluA family pseudouridine synthase [Spirochaetales bacterium]|nr:RluA family pseudouridine synthase [Spirochaetales bacterium]